MNRLYFDEIDSVGIFPDNRIKMDVLFQDSKGNEYVWTPKWEEVMSIYSESEKVEELNVAEGKWLDRIREKKQFSVEVLDVISEVVAEGKRTDELAEFFEALGFSGGEFRYNVGMDLDAKSRVESWKNRHGATKKKLMELNSEDYRHIVQIVSRAADPRQYIGEEEGQKEALEKLNEALQFENMRVTEDGRVLPLKRD